MDAATIVVNHPRFESGGSPEERESLTLNELSVKARELARAFTQWKVWRAEGQNAPERRDPEELRAMEKLMYALASYLDGEKTAGDVIASVAGESHRSGIEMRAIGEYEEKDRQQYQRIKEKLDDEDMAWLKTHGIRPPEEPEKP